MRPKRRKTGMPPGTPMFTGDRISLLTDTTCIKYNDEEITELKDYDQLDWKHAIDHQYWLDIRGVQDTSYIERIGHQFEIHPLALEDVVDVDQRPKMDEYENAIFVSILALKINKQNGALIKEQVTLYFGQHFLISFQEDADDFLAPIRERMYNKKGRIRPRGIDFLAYSIIDFIVDHYYEALDYIEKKLSEIDQSLHTSNNEIPKEMLHDMKIQIIRIRKSIYPMREVINRFIRTDNPLIHKETDIYLRDLADHSIQISDMSETYQDMINSLHDLYQTEISNRMNSVMKILTIISTIFIPLNFIAGIYGMNFAHMPELQYRYGYYGVLIFMFVVALIFLFYFRRKKWI